jgi:uncharacterized protein
MASLAPSDHFFDLGLVSASARDLIAAHKWFNLAALTGDSRAQAERADIASELTAAQIAEAQRQARAYLKAA